jgi:hypothetical protein
MVAVTEDIAQQLLERDASENDLNPSAKTFVGRVLDTATRMKMLGSNQRLTQLLLGSESGAHPLQ